MEVLELNNKDTSIKCFNGYVCEFVYNGKHNLIHRGGLPKELRSEDDNLRIKKGAPKYSNITPFPYGGIPEQVFVGKEKIINRERHGLSRSLPWEILSKNSLENEIIFMQNHDGKTPIKNIKYDPSKKGYEYLDPMFPFEIYRSYELLDKGILHSCIKVNNPGDESFKYSLWDHPIFISPNDLGKGNFYFKYKNKKDNFNLEEVSKLKGNVKLLNGIENISFINSESGVGFYFDSKGFGNLMIWSPEGKGVFSIESKSHSDIEREFPSANSQSLNPNFSKRYFIDITPFLI